MRRLLNNKIWVLLLLLICFMTNAFAAEDTANNQNQKDTITRTNLVTQQINLLKDRLKQSTDELTKLKTQHDKDISEFTLENANKRLLDKAALDISVSSSNLDSINIELTDTQQIINWLEKNIQEIENQVNVLGVFGIKVADKSRNNIKEMQYDSTYQQKLLHLEKLRLKNLTKLQSNAVNILQYQKDKYNRLGSLLNSRNMLHVKQQQVKDELSFQEKQNYWLNEVTKAYNNIDTKNSGIDSKEYAENERMIFYANENANLAYIQSLIARYKDQIVQMRLSIVRSNSITLLNEIGDQVQILSKQLKRLEVILNDRTGALDKHIAFLGLKKTPVIKEFVGKLDVIKDQYSGAEKSLARLNQSLTTFRTTLDGALQKELSSRRGLPVLSVKTFLDVGKETLLIPALTFHVIKSLYINLSNGFKATSGLSWSFFGLFEGLLIFTFFFLRKQLNHLLETPSQWRDQINSKWLSLQWLKRNFLDLFIIGNLAWVLYYFQVPQQNYLFLYYMAIVWLILKSVLTIARICLVETAHDAQGDDIKLYRRLKWMVYAGGIITCLTVFVHQLPLIYEIKTLCDSLFLLLLMMVAILLLKSSAVLPNLVLPHLKSQHPYLQSSIRLIGIIIPLLMLTNSVIGLFGYVNLIITISWYEGVFLIVLICYLILRGLLSDGMEQLSRIMIQYVNNGWLWTEAVLKPLDKVLKITLLLFAGATLFLLYGWDQKSPIVERLLGLMHYQLIRALNTTITPLSIIELGVVISIFYWSAKWTREFVYRLLLSRTKDMGIRNSIAIISQYSVVVIGAFLCLRVLGIDLQALAAIAAAFALGVGLGLRDLANNFASGFLLLLERPLRVGDIVNINGVEGEVISIGGRAVTMRTWDHMELLVPNAEIFSKSFTNLTAHDNIVRGVVNIKISRYDNPHEVKVIIQNVLVSHKDVLSDPMPEVFLKDMSETLMNFELRYYVNLKQITSRTAVLSSILMSVWDEFSAHDIKPPYPQQEIFIRADSTSAVMPLIDNDQDRKPNSSN